MNRPRLILIGFALLILVGCASGGSSPNNPLDPGLDATARQERFETIYAMVSDQLLMQHVRPASSPMTREDTQKLSRRLKYALFLISEEPESVEANLNLGQLFAAAVPLGWPAAPQLSELFLQKVVEDTPERPRAHHLLGVLHLLTGDLQGSLSHLERAQRLDREGDEPRIMLALGQVYYLMEEQRAATMWLERYLEQVPEDQLVRAFLSTVRLGVSDEPLEFRIPQRFEPAPFRPSETLAAVNFPRIEYRNLRHGFALSFPYTWTLYDEEVDYPLGPCRPMAELTLDLPLKETDEGGVISDRIRLLSYPVPSGLTSERFSRERLPIYEYPQALAPVEEPVIPGSIHLSYSETGKDGLERQGEVIFHVSNGVGYFIHFMSTPTTFDLSFDRFRGALQTFKTLPHDAAGLAPGCQEHPI